MSISICRVGNADSTLVTQKPEFFGHCPPNRQCHLFMSIQILHQALLPHPNPPHESGEGAIIPPLARGVRGVVQDVSLPTYHFLILLIQILKIKSIFIFCKISRCKTLIVALKCSLITNKYWINFSLQIYFCKYFLTKVNLSAWNRNPRKYWDSAESLTLQEIGLSSCR